MKIIDELYFEVYNIIIKVGDLRRDSWRAMIATITILSIFITLNLSVIFHEFMNAERGYFICFIVAIILDIVYEFAGRHKTVMLMKVKPIKSFITLFYFILSIVLVLKR